MKLVYNDQSGRERSVEMGTQNSIVMVGRNADCGIQTNNASVSRVHAMITCKDAKVFVQDPPNARPTNGTKVDGMRLQQGEVLELFAGSELVCGNFVIRVVSDGSNDIIAPMGGKPIEPLGPGGPRDMRAAPGMNYAPQGPYASQAPIPHGHMVQGPQAPMMAGQLQNAPQLVAPVMNSGVGQRPLAQAPQQAVQKPAQVVAQNMPQGQVNFYDPQRGKRTVGRGQYSPAAPPSAGPVNNDDFIRVQDELSAARREINDLRVGIIAKDDEIKSFRERVEERDRTITDYERRSEYHETVVTGLKDMIDKLKEQLDHQKDQNQESRRELLASEEKTENLEIELSMLKETLESKGMATSNQETTIANLKVQLTQKNRQLSELQREFDLAQYSAKEERENAERLEQNVEELNTLLEETQRRSRDMKKVVEQHEVMYGELKSSLEERAREIRSLQDALRAKGGGDSAMLLSELSQVKESLARKTREYDMVSEQLRSAEEAIAQHIKGDGSGDMAARVAELEEELKQGGQELVRQLQIELSDLKRENLDLQDALSEMRMSGGQDKPDGGMLIRLSELYKRVNDNVSQWRDDLDAMENAINDLQRVFVAYVRIDPINLMEQDKLRVENMLRDYDPKIIFEDIANLLDMSQTSLGEIKEALRELRGTLQT